MCSKPEVHTAIPHSFTAEKRPLVQITQFYHIHQHDLMAVWKPASTPISPRGSSSHGLDAHTQLSSKRWTTGLQGASERLQGLAGGYKG